MKCPCCGSAHPGDTPRVDLTFNMIVFPPTKDYPEGRMIQLRRPKLAELAHLLTEKAGRLVRETELYSGLWGINEVTNARNVLANYVSRLRKVLRDSCSGWEILNVQEQGFILLPANERQRRFGNAKIWREVAA